MTEKSCGGDLSNFDRQPTAEPGIDQRETILKSENEGYKIVLRADKS
jgi:hypothetical protein